VDRLRWEIQIPIRASVFFFRLNAFTGYFYESRPSQSLETTDN
jgi:hypothetical protein